MSNESDSECRSRCLPNCQDILYETSVSTAPFRFCDHTNLGSSPFCDLNNPDMNPSIWMQAAKEEFESTNLDVPDYLESRPGKLSSTRKAIANKKLAKDLTFLEHFRKFPNYEAFDKDIAIANFYFDQSNVIQYRRGLRMTMVDFISQMGGILGLSIGLSFISFVEIIYFIVIRLARNVNKSDKVQSNRYKRKQI